MLNAGASQPCPPPAEPDRTMVEHAAAWHILLQAEDASAEDRAACAAWRQENPAHELAWQRMQTLWARFDTPLPGTAHAALDAALAVPPRPPRRRRAAATTLALLLAAGLIAVQAPPPEVLLADHRSGIGERLGIALPDRSQLLLDSDSAIDIHYDGEQRRIVLLRGALLADVAPDTSRPFIVDTPQGSARALGTRYTVRRDDASHSTVTVLESTVETCDRPATGAPACLRLRPGQQVRLDDSGLGTPTEIDTTAAAAWTRGQLAVDDRPLTEVLQILGRHRHGLLRFDAEQLAGMRVSGVFPLDDPDRALQALATTLSLRVRHYTPWLVIVDKPAAG